MLNDDTFAKDAEERMLLSLAHQEIEQLRRWYAVATDALGRKEDGLQVERGREIYRRIFAPEAQMNVRGGQVDLKGRGPESWADVAADALADYAATQHLIGSQVVTFKEAAFSGTPKVLTSGAAAMSSYVQAWHAWPDDNVRVVIGTYEDSVRYNPAVGWQIERMVLVYQSGERRPLGDPP